MGINTGDKNTMMTRKHYEAIAAILRAYWLAKVGSNVEPDYLILALVRYFQTDNPNFNTTRFYRACGLSEKGNGFLTTEAFEEI